MPSLYANYLDPELKAATIPGQTVKYDFSTPESAREAPKPRDASLKFIPRKQTLQAQKKPQAGPRFPVKPVPKVMDEAVAGKKESTTTDENATTEQNKTTTQAATKGQETITAQTTSTTPSATANPNATTSSIDKWVTKEDEEDPWAAEYVRRQQETRKHAKAMKKNKKNQDQNYVEWESIYDPTRPTRLDLYRGSEEHGKSVHDWKMRLHAKRKETVTANSAPSQTEQPPSTDKTPSNPTIPTQAGPVDGPGAVPVDQPPADQTARAPAAPTDSAPAAPTDDKSRAAPIEDPRAAVVDKNDASCDEETAPMPPPRLPTYNQLRDKDIIVDRVRSGYGRGREPARLDQLYKEFRASLKEKWWQDVQDWTVTDGHKRSWNRFGQSGFASFGAHMDFKENRDWDVKFAHDLKPIPTILYCSDSEEEVDDAKNRFGASEPYVPPKLGKGRSSQRPQMSGAAGQQSTQSSTQSELLSTFTPAAADNVEAPQAKPFSQTSSATALSAAPVMYNPPSTPTSDVPLPDRLAQGTEDGSADKPRSSRPSQSGIGKRLLEKFGWEEGQGLGASNDGITTILRAQPEKRKKRPDSEGGGWIGPTGGVARIVGGKKQKTSHNNSDKEVSEMAWSQVAVFKGMLRGIDVDKQLQEGTLMQDVGEAMGKFGIVERLFLERKGEDEGRGTRVFVKFTSALSAYRAIQASSGKDFLGNGRLVESAFFDEAKFEEAAWD